MTRASIQLHGALLLMAAAALTSCSADDGQEQEVMQTRTWCVSVPTDWATPTTRSTMTESSGTLTAAWSANDAVLAYKSGSSIGTVYAAAAGTSATLTGTLSGSFAVDDELTLYYPGVTPDYTTQAGTLASISVKDYVEASVTVNAVDGSSGILGTTTATFSHRQSFTKFTFSEAVHSVVISATDMSDITVTAASGDQTDFYVALPLEGSVEYTFLCTTNAGAEYRGTKTGDLTNGRYYTTNVDIAPGVGVTNTSTWGDGGYVIGNATTPGNIYF